MSIIFTSEMTGYEMFWDMCFQFDRVVLFLISDEVLGLDVLETSPTM